VKGERQLSARTAPRPVGPCRPSACMAARAKSNHPQHIVSGFSGGDAPQRQFFLQGFLSRTYTRSAAWSVAPSLAGSCSSAARTAAESAPRRPLHGETRACEVLTALDGGGAAGAACCCVRSSRRIRRARTTHAARRGGESEHDEHEHVDARRHERQRDRVTRHHIGRA